MASCNPPRSALPPADSHWLSLHRSRFLESLTAQGYAVRTVKSFRLMVGRLCAQAQARSLGPCALDANVIGELADACPRTGTSHMERELAMATRRFTAYLVHVGVIVPTTPTPPPLDSPEPLCAELDRWLRNHQGMFGNRVRVHRKVLRRIIGFCCTATGTVDDLAAVTPEAIFAFLDGCAGRAGWRLTYVRNILRFLFWSGRIPRDLSDGVPRASGGRAHGLPRPLEASVVHKLLEAVRGDCAIDRRNHAMLLLMAHLGLAGAGSGQDTARRHRLGRGPDAGPRQRPAVRPCAGPRGHRRSHRRLAVQRAQGKLAPPVRLRAPSLRTVHIVRARA